MWPPNLSLGNPQTCVKLACLRPRFQSTASGLPYHVLRNARGSLPLYSDIRNAGTRYQIQVRNIEGDANALLRDLRATLFPPGSPESDILRGKVIRSKHIVLQGPGRGWKENVADWLRARGF
ncbi:hypothetical protein JB92DRAFT_500684 [Gautieria morchelliformis]|nr:hypothetical protein JB92DRAFT_500684 [Gautieria morchelliformis]